MRTTQSKGHRRGKDQHPQQDIPFRRLKEQLDVIPGKDDEQYQGDEQDGAAHRTANDNGDDAHKAGKLDGRQAGVHDPLIGRPADVQDQVYNVLGEKDQPHE